MERLIENMAEKIKINVKGKDYNINPMVRGHRLTDDEIEKIQEGKAIELQLTAKSGTPYNLLCRFNPKCSFVNGKGETITYPGIETKMGFPISFCSHTFTNEEKTLLKNGKKLLIKGYVSQKTGNSFDAETTYTKGKIELHFDNVNSQSNNVNQTASTNTDTLADGVDFDSSLISDDDLPF